MIDLCERASSCFAEGHVEGRDCVVVGEAKVTSLWRGQFQDVPARLIEQEHELASRSYSGLFSSMRRAYGEAFTEGQDVTVVSNERLS